MNLRRGLGAAAGICSVVAPGVALESGDPAHAVGPPADGNYTFNEAGVSGVTWTITALCDQPSGTRVWDAVGDEEATILVADGRPPPSPIQRYPLYCNGIAMCY